MKSFDSFITEAKRGRPRKLRPGEEADVEHIQAQLSKLTHPNHVDVQFKDGSKHKIPRGHANKALLHLSSLKPIDRDTHAAHMGKGHDEFYHVLTTKSVPKAKTGITLAGPKLRKEEAELDEAKDTDKPERSEHSWPTRRNKQGGWHWANSYTGGHASKEAADRHAQAMGIKMKNTKVPLDMLKPGDKPVGNPVGLGGKSRGIPRWAKKSVKEEAEQIDEISKTTLVNYMTKADKQVKDFSKKYKKGTDTDADFKQLDKRLTGMNTAKNKFYKRAKVAATGKDKAYDLAQNILIRKQKKVKEEAEQIDEISSGLARSYIKAADKSEKKARADLYKHSWLDMKDKRNGEGLPPESAKMAHADLKKANKREGGISLARGKLTGDPYTKWEKPKGKRNITQVTRDTKVLTKEEIDKRDSHHAAASRARALMKKRDAVKEAKAVDEPPFDNPTKTPSTPYTNPHAKAKQLARSIMKKMKDRATQKKGDK